MATKRKRNVSKGDRRTLKMLAEAAKELGAYDDAVRLAMLASGTRSRKYPRPNLASPLRLVIASSR